MLIAQLWERMDALPPSTANLIHLLLTLVLLIRDLLCVVMLLAEKQVAWTVPIQDLISRPTTYT